MRDPADQHPLWLEKSPLVLASASQARFHLLISAGIPVQVVPAQIDERAIEAPLLVQGLPAGRIALALAEEKARSVARNMTDRWILGADQVLALDGVQLHKPTSRSAAAKQIEILSGRRHHLYSAVAIVKEGRIAASFVVSASLTMRPLSPGMIAGYLDAAGDAVLDSVGGYQLERSGIHLFHGIRGDHSTILGLPMLQTLNRLRKLKLVMA